MNTFATYEKSWKCYRKQNSMLMKGRLNSSATKLISLVTRFLRPALKQIVLGSPVQSGFLAFLAKTGTETGPSKLIHLEKLDRDRKRPQNQSLRSFCSL